MRGVRCRGCRLHALEEDGVSYTDSLLVLVERSGRQAVDDGWLRYRRGEVPSPCHLVLVRGLAPERFTEDGAE